MPNAVKKTITYFLVVLLSIYTLVWFLSPYIFPRIINPILAPYQLVLDEGSSISYNPITAHIDIDDLGISTLPTASSPAKQVLALKDLEFEVRLYQFLFDDIYISEFFIDGLFIDISVNDDATYIAGINISKESHENTSANEENSIEEQAPIAFPYTIYLPDMEVKSSHINLVFNAVEHHIHFKAFTMKDVELALDTQYIDLNIESEVDDAAFYLGIKGSLADRGQQGEFFIDLGIEEYQLSRIAQHVGLVKNTLQGAVSYEATHTLLYNKGSIEVKAPLLELGLNKALFVQDNHQYEIDDVSVELQDLVVTSDADIDISGEGHLTLTGFNTLHTVTQEVIAELATATIPGIKLTTVNNKPHVNLDTITLEDFAFSQTQLPNTPALISFKQLLLNKADITDASLDINEISLLGLNVNAHINPDKKIVNLIDALQSKPSEQNEPTSIATGVSVEAPQLSKIESPKTLGDATVAINTSKPDGESPAPSFLININGFSIADNAHISFLDQSVTPEYAREITITTLTVGKVNNTHPELSTPISVKGSSDKYAKFDINVLAKPLLALPEYKFDAKVNEVDLPGVSSYIADALGYEIRSGQLDVKVKGDLKGNIIDSDVDLHLRGVNLEKLEQEDEAVATEKTDTADKKLDVQQGKKDKPRSVIPFDIALNTLKDSNDNIDLSMPITGDVTSPNFGLSGFINIILKKAVTTAAREYLLATVLPYANIVNIAISAVEGGLLQINISPLSYKPKQIEVGNDNAEFIKTFTQLLKDKPDLNVKVCARVTPEDIDKKRTDKLSAEDRKALSAFGKQRASDFKDYMIEKKNVASSRILFCKTKISQEPKAKTELTFTF